MILVDPCDITVWWKLTCLPTYSGTLSRKDNSWNTSKENIRRKRETNCVWICSSCHCPSHPIVEEFSCRKNIFCCFSVVQLALAVSIRLVGRLQLILFFWLSLVVSLGLRKEQWYFAECFIMSRVWRIYPRKTSSQASRLCSSELITHSLIGEKSF